MNEKTKTQTHTPPQGPRTRLVRGADGAVILSFQYLLAPRLLVITLYSNIPVSPRGWLTRSHGDRTTLFLSFRIPDPTIGTGSLVSFPLTGQFWSDAYDRWVESDTPMPWSNLPEGYLMTAHPEAMTKALKLLGSYLPDDEGELQRRRRIAAALQRACDELWAQQNDYPKRWPAEWVRVRNVGFGRCEFELAVNELDRMLK